MRDYRTIGKTDWFIQKLRSDWFSRVEIVELAAKEFSDVLHKTLDGTIGQYWSDSVNPKWGTFKAIQALGLTVVENNGRRRIVERGGAFSAPRAKDRLPKQKIVTDRPSNPTAQLQLRDVLVDFDWTTLYRRYDARCYRFDPQSSHLKTVRPDADEDRTLYSWLVQAAQPDASGRRQGADIAWYEALLYWKLYSQPAAVHNIAEWLCNKCTRRDRNAAQLRRLIAELPCNIAEELAAVNSVLKVIDKYQVDGMGMAALPVRTTFLHILYPTIVPIFDKMVRQAVGLPDDDQSMEVFRQYLPHAWTLAHRHAQHLTGFSETPVRLTDMALWVIRANSSRR